MKKIALILSLLLCSFWLQAQSLQLFDPSLKWILKTNKIEKKQIIFTEYNIAQVDINTMVWSFLPNGRIAYDYESSGDVFACLGVDFLDLDLDECRWQYDHSLQKITLLLKGGYASIDDFVFKRVYKIELLDEEQDYGYVLKLENEYFYNDLTKNKK